MRVRDALRRLTRCDWSVERLQNVLGAARSEIGSLLEALLKSGLVEAADRPGCWRTTSAGNAFALASARPVSRRVAQRHVEALLARLAEVRADDRWLYKARRVYLFGRFRDPTLEVVGNVDLAVDLVPKVRDDSVRRELERAYIQRQWDDGRIFRSFQQERMSPLEDVMRYLKKRSWILSLHPVTELPAEAPSRLLYEDPDA